MARGRRRAADETPVSFFSFQDVMMCTIGITLISTMILIMQLGRAAAASAPRSMPRGTVEVDAELARLLVAHEEISRALGRDIRERKDDAEGVLASAAIRLPGIDEDLRRLRREIEEARARRNEALVRASQDTEALLAARLEEERDRLRDQIRELSGRRRIVYLRAPTETRLPLVVEISSARVVISPDQSREPAISLSAGDPGMAAKQVIAFFKSMPDRDSRYLLVVLKPSGIPVHLRLREALREDPEMRGVPNGLDLIPEDYWTDDLFPAREDMPKGAGR